MPVVRTDGRAYGYVNTKISRVGMGLRSRAWSSLKMHFYGKGTWSSSVASANAMPTLVRDSQVVLIVHLICPDERVYKEIIFCKTKLISIKVKKVKLTL